MKTMVLCLFLACAPALMQGQIRPYLQKGRVHNEALRTQNQQDDIIPATAAPNHIVASKIAMDDPNLGITRFDKQTNASNQTRVYLFPDGKIGATFTISHTDDFVDRGTGYNFYNGTSWGPMPASRIETVRTGWPAYAPFGANGEIVVAHQRATNPLIVSTRPTKGTGAWTQAVLYGPPGAAGLDWPRVITNGPDRTWIHILAVTGVTTLGGSVYQGLDGAIVYTRSLDGGITWSSWEILDGMTSQDYIAFNGDTYNWAQPRGDTLAFAVGDSWYDLFLMKSTDNGDTWTKTLIWSCLYNKWTGVDSVSRHYCPDGSLAVALDNDGMTHLVFGLQQARGEIGGDKFWYPFTDGLIYWNESMPELPQELDPDTLFEHGNYIGWIPDTMVYYAQISEMASYYMSMSSMPTMTIDEQGRIFVIWSGVTNLRDPYNFMLRHIFQRASLDNGTTWADTIIDLTAGFVYQWAECVFPTMSPTTDDKLYFLFQQDTEAGIYQNSTGGGQGQSSITENNMIFMTADKDLMVGKDDGKPVKFTTLEVSQNYPNPFSTMTTIGVILDRPVPLSLKVFNAIGTVVAAEDRGMVNAGSHRFIIDGNKLTPGIYFYSVSAGDQRVTKKMIR